MYSVGKVLSFPVPVYFYLRFRWNWNFGFSNLNMWRDFKFKLKVSFGILWKIMVALLTIKWLIRVEKVNWSSNHVICILVGMVISTSTSAMSSSNDAISTAFIAISNSYDEISTWIVQFLNFKLSLAITVAICHFGIISILLMRGSYLVLVCLKSIYQPLWLFSRLFFLCLFDMRASQKASRTALMFLNFDLSEHSGLMYLGGGSLDPLFIVFTLLQRHKLDSIV